jgi:hypothetical protein
VQGEDCSAIREHDETHRVSEAWKTAELNSAAQVVTVRDGSQHAGWARLPLRAAGFSPAGVIIQKTLPFRGGIGPRASGIFPDALTDVSCSGRGFEF